MFVVYGMPRSGTTLVAQVLNAHPELLVPDETDFMVPAAHAFRLVDDPDAGRRLLGDLIASTDRFEATLGRWLTADQVRRAVADAPPVSNSRSAADMASLSATSCALATVTATSAIAAGSVWRRSSTSLSMASAAARTTAPAELAAAEMSPTA